RVAVLTAGEEGRGCRRAHLEHGGRPAVLRDIDVVEGDPRATRVAAGPTHAKARGAEGRQGGDIAGWGHGVHESRGLGRRWSGLPVAGLVRRDAVEVVAVT